jgi:hypothetical protein
MKHRTVSAIIVEARIYEAAPGPRSFRTFTMYLSPFSPDAGDEGQLVLIQSLTQNTFLVADNLSSLEVDAFPPCKSVIKGTATGSTGFMLSCFGA